MGEKKYTLKIKDRFMRERLETAIEEILKKYAPRYYNVLNKYEISFEDSNKLSFKEAMHVKGTQNKIFVGWASYSLNLIDLASVIVHEIIHYILIKEMGVYKDQPEVLQIHEIVALEGQIRFIEKIGESKSEIIEELREDKERLRRGGMPDWDN